MCIVSPLKKHDALHPKGTSCGAYMDLIYLAISASFCEFIKELKVSMYGYIDREFWGRMIP